MMKFSQNTIFRFRPYSPLSFKELLYGEIFFVSKDELNDPYDTKNPSVFKADSVIYNRLLQYILNDKLSGFSFLKEKINIVDTQSIANYLAKEDLLYDDIVRVVSSTEFENIVINAFRIEESIGLSLAFIKRLKHFIHKYCGSHCYIASFSKECTDPVMWSHYSHNHTGFCLCFSINENKIISKTKSKFLQSEYQFEEVTYQPENVTTNGFYCFPGAIYGQTIEEEERLNYWKIKKRSFLVKYISWHYENEVRIIHDDWLTDNACENGVMKKSVSDRTFYYDQKQLTGIILGSKMGTNNKNEIRNAIIKLRENINLVNDCLPVFVFYESLENTVDYKMKIKPIDGLDIFNRHFEISLLDIKQSEYQKNKEHFNRQLK